MLWQGERDSERESAHACTQRQRENGTHTHIHTHAHKCFTHRHTLTRTDTHADEKRLTVQGALSVCAQCVCERLSTKPQLTPRLREREREREIVRRCFLWICARVSMILFICILLRVDI